MYIWILGGEEMDQRFVKKKDAGIMKETRVEMEGKGEKGIREENGKGEERREISRLAPRFTDESHGPDFTVFANKTEQKDILKLLTQGYW